MRTIPLIAVLCHVTLALIGPDEITEGDPLVLKCSSGLLASKIPLDPSTVVEEFAISRKTDVDNSCSTMVTNDLVNMGDCFGPPNFTHPMASFKRWSVERNGDGGPGSIRLIIPRATSSDSGKYFCEVILLYDNKFRYLRYVSQHIIVKEVSFESKKDNSTLLVDQLDMKEVPYDIDSRNIHIARMADD
ncbi:unnamed protein product [Lymnaea stagnalis]|uniref:Ig-like domain-containing protein n=1 Tax=Lymnaea stagnalis TaxID=6523 RepID=A0AAV2H1W3_LYMST